MTVLTWCYIKGWGCFAPGKREACRADEKMSKKDKEGKFVPSGHVGSGEVATVDVTMRSHHGLPSAGGAGAAASTASESANYTATGYVPGTLQGGMHGYRGALIAVCYMQTGSVDADGII